MAKREVKKEEGGGANWQDTYGDMITLVLTFFVLLYSFSTIDAGKWTEIVESFTGAPPKQAAVTTDVENDPDFKFIKPIAQINPKAQKKEGREEEQKGEMAGDTDGQMVLVQMSGGEEMVMTSEELAMLLSSPTYQAVEEQFAQLYDSLQTYIQAHGLEDMLYLDRDVDSIYLRVTSGLLFDSGYANLRPDALLILEELDAVFAASLDAIESLNIEGHTDSVPISNAQFKDNRELSSERANNVARYFEGKGNVPREIILGVGYGEYQPIDTNETEEGKQNNRRVEFVLRKKVVTLADIEGEAVQLEGEEIV